MRRLLMIIVFGLLSWLGLASTASADWVCVAVIPLDHASCLGNPLPDPLPLPDEAPVDPVTAAL